MRRTGAGDGIALSVRDARKSYGETHALDGASFDLRQGEWLALLGPNGAGKTTLVRAIAGRVKLDAGEIAFPTATAHLGVVPQELALYPRLTARENLEVFGALQELSGAMLTERVDWALEFTGLADRAREQIASFSGGMKRRLNIGCGVLHRPPIVILDEPTVGVDPQSRERICAMLGELQQAGASLLLTTHQLDEVQQYCDRIVIVDHGRTIASGTLEELIAATVGRGKRVTLRLEGGETPGAVRMNDVALELPALLAEYAAAGRRVDDIAVDTPSLHEVFLHLTGRELRE